MAIPDSAKGAILDAGRLLAFNLDTPVNTLVLYDEKGLELVSITGWWGLDDRGRRGGKNFDGRRLRIVERGQTLDTFMEQVDSVRYLVQTTPDPTPSDLYSVKVADRPEAGKNRQWTLAVIKPKFKSKFFGAQTVNR